MIDNKGWVKTYRSLMDKGYYTDSCAVHLWTHIIFKANHSEREFMWNGSIIKVERGSFVTGRKKLSLETGIEESKIYRLLKMFESEQQIEQRTNNRNSIITVVNYDEYQASEQRMNNGRTTDEQRMNTTKELKHLENEKELKLEKQKRFAPPSLDEVIQLFKEKGSTELEAEKFFYFYESKNWMVGKVKMKSWTASVNSWLARNKSKAIEDRGVISTLE